MFNAVKDFNPSSIVQIHSTLLGSFWLMEVTVCVNNCCYTDFHAEIGFIHIHAKKDHVHGKSKH